MNLRTLAAILVMIGSLASGPGAAQAPADTTAIRGIIEQQLAAFGRDDGPGAFAFASPGHPREIRFAGDLHGDGAPPLPAGLSAGRGGLPGAQGQPARPGPGGPPDPGPTGVP